ncbi:MAG: C25 family cysteine peptidase [Bacteroidales bacterium]
MKSAFGIPTDSLKRFVLFSPADAMQPAMITKPLPNQDLHSGSGYDMIIVTHPLFREYAGELAQIHAEIDSYNTVVVTPDEIYNEFSGGIKDISAIRNYVRMIRDRGDALSRPLKNLLLFGDGSFENITPPPANPSFIPTYQTQNSNVNILLHTQTISSGFSTRVKGSRQATLTLVSGGYRFRPGRRPPR